MGRAIRVGRPADYVTPTDDTSKMCMGTGILGTPGDAGVDAFAAAPAAGHEPDMTKATKVIPSAGLRLIDSCITQLKAQGPTRTCNESREEEGVRPWTGVH